MERTSPCRPLPFWVVLLASPIRREATHRLRLSSSLNCNQSPHTLSEQRLAVGRVPCSCPLTPASVAELGSVSITLSLLRGVEAGVAPGAAFTATPHEGGVQTAAGLRQAFAGGWCRVPVFFAPPSWVGGGVRSARRGGPGRSGRRDGASRATSGPRSGPGRVRL